MKYDLRRLKSVFSGAAPLGAPLVKAFTDKLKSVGADCAVTQGAIRCHHLDSPMTNDISK